MDDIPTDVQLTNPHKFDERFLKHAASSSTYQAAYEKTEQDYRAVFGQNKYTGFHSFRVARYRRVKKKVN